MKTRATIQLPTGMRLVQRTPTFIDHDRRQGHVTACIVDVDAGSASIAVTIELDIEIEAVFDSFGKQNNLANTRGVSVGFVAPAVQGDDG